MKIEGLNNDKKKVSIETIAPGQCFRFKDFVLMMIKPASNSCLLEAVNIENGSRMTVLNRKALVTPVCVEATIFEEV